MAGLIDTGEMYKNNALSGFVRESAEQQKIDQENKELDAQQQQQTTRNVTSGVSAAISIGLLIAACA
jgi:hypothetical protein